MLEKIIRISLNNKLLVLLFTFALFCYGIYAVFNIPIGAVPDITNNQVQVITTSTNLSTEDIELFITYPIEMEMANLPGVKEIRSVSKFGLSVVTIVFEESMGTYLPRQLIAEKIKKAAEFIPEGFGTPEMGPISTGLGEIYQYILDVKPAYRDRYSVADLRTIQDWVVKRQLSGIPGVVEINTWGGYLKQYEVAINPSQLKAMNITPAEIVIALNKNNSIAGGAYIEKVNQSYFIRGEGKISSIDDIEHIVVKNSNGIPTLIKDVAIVQFGYANRFGAITGNGQGEKVLGQIMMLKGADSKKVIAAVKERVAKIDDLLPEGIYINPFLERSELVSKTTFTVAENLILGSLIVIFVVKYDRVRIAQYGLNIADINEIVALSFAGKTVGTVFEGERRFDLVVRLEEHLRNDIEHLRNLYIPLQNGGQIPLREVAVVDYTKGPAKISRDDTQRRVVIGVNVRNRDLQSVVTDIAAVVNAEVSLPAGYSVTYGGQFENLQNAKNRLAIAVPLALCLIFILLYFAFGSLLETLLVFSAIPLSAVGGVYLLWIRGMPFSISAGVGFIALFGIAVLNGIVLIEHLKELKSQNKGNIDDLVLKGAIDRLRPVALTATAAALGFLPMAISSSAGAEVQRPLATVVIGGLFTATMLTMIVLPVLFKMFDGKETE